jgi:glutamine synthetase
MNNPDYKLRANLLEQYLEKPAGSFTREDIVRYVAGNGIKMLNFRYVAEDGKLKILNFVIHSREYLEAILSTGERVDGSSLFSYIEAASSDLYVIPRFSTAYVNPFALVPTLDILCSFYTSEGVPLETAPEYILRKAHRLFRERTGFTFKAMGELEYYVQGKKEELYPAEDQRGYHTASPFSNYEYIRLEAMDLIARCGGNIKYGHSEVGNFSTDAETFEQHEIEFLPVDVEDAVDQLVLAKWILRQLGEKYAVNISFAPKITVGKAGSGLHVHMYLEKDGRNQMVDGGRLSDTARKMIAGLMDLAGPLTAFGNTIPTSYLRLVPHQEAPTNICWGDRNRSVLVRVPLGWLGDRNMVGDANPQDAGLRYEGVSKQTVEIRSPDGSADLYHLFAGLVVAALHGLEMPGALQKAENLYVDVNIFRPENKQRLNSLEKLPDCCYGSAGLLESRRSAFEKDGVFPARTIDSFIRKLRSYGDQGLSERLYGKTDEIRTLVYRYLHHM